MREERMLEELTRRQDFKIDPRVFEGEAIFVLLEECDAGTLLS
jgi:hypothetical protein